MHVRSLIKAILADDEALACAWIRNGANPCSAVVHKKILVFPILAACYMGHLRVIRASLPLSEPVVARALVCAAASPYGREVVELLIEQSEVKITAYILQWAARRRNPRAVILLSAYASTAELSRAIANAISEDRVRSAAAMLTTWQEQGRVVQPRIFMVRSRKAWALLARHGLQPSHSIHCQIEGLVAQPPYVCCASLGDATGMLRELRRPGIDSKQLRRASELAATNVSAIARLARRGFSASTSHLWPDSSIRRFCVLMRCLYKIGFDAVIIDRVLLFVARD